MNTIGQSAKSNANCARVLWVTLLVVAVYTHLSSGSLTHYIKPIGNDVTRIEGLGVHYRYTPGRILLQTRRKPVLGALHLWLKAVEVNADQIQLQGFYYFAEAKRPRLWASLKLENPPFTQKYNLYMSVVENRENDWNLHKVNVTPPVDLYRPGWMDVMLPRKEHYMEYSLFIEDWARYWPLDPVLRTAVPVAMRSQQNLEVYTVIGQFYRIPQQQAQQYVQLHVEYHVKLGATGTLFYFADEFRPYFQDSHALQSLQERGRLHMVAWPYLPRLPDAYTYDQAVIFNHALLAAWGRGTWLFFTDMDEFVATPQPSSFQQLLSGCFRQGDQIMLKEYDTLCSSCMGDGGQGEEKAWLSKAGFEPLRSYNLRNPKDLSAKVIIYPDKVFQFFVHDGKYRQPGLEVRVDADTCAYVAHFRNMIDKRVHDVKDYTNDTRWHWILDA